MKTKYRDHWDFVYKITVILTFISTSMFIGMITSDKYMGCKEIKYKEHDMIEYYNTRTGMPISVCHSPECKKCLTVFD
jgi:hypothetical protein